jgi:hypothetical protein
VTSLTARSIAPLEKESTEAGVVAATGDGGSRRIWRRLEFWKIGGSAVSVNAEVSAGCRNSVSDEATFGAKPTTSKTVVDGQQTTDAVEDDDNDDDVVTSASDDMRVGDWSTFIEDSSTSVVTSQPTSTNTRKHQQHRESDVILLP